MSILFRGFQFLKHKIIAGDEHSVHSPSFYFYTTAIQTQKQFYSFDIIESLRKICLGDPTQVTVTDLGAGSSKLKSNTRSVSEIAKVSSKDSRIGQLLFRLVWLSKSKTILELGTSLGLTTSYLASADTKSTVYTLEGCPEISAIANRNFRKLNLKNIVLENNSIESGLSKILQQAKQLDFVFIDANHRYTPTINYFKQLLPFLHTESIVVFDDIYWSKEMKKAWDEIRQHDRVTISIDLYYCGIVFFRTNAPKQHYTLRI